MLRRSDRPLQDVFHQLFELRARQFQLQVLGPRSIRCQERQVDVGLLHLRQLDLGFFSGFLHALDRHAVFADVNALILLEFGGQPLDNAIVDIIAAQVRVTRRRLHFNHALANFENRDVEGAAA